MLDFNGVDRRYSGVASNLLAPEGSATAAIAHLVVAF
jgi:hypothetical protein